MSEIQKLTSYSEGFGIFHKIAEHEFDVNNKNYLRLFMLNTENKLFNYDELYEYLLPNIARYVFDRKKLSEAEKDPIRQSLILIDAINHLRKITSDADRGAGGELGEILLYLFLEQDLRAPKLFSKVELKTSNMDYVKGSDGIHYRFRTTAAGTKVLQLIIGEAKILNSLKNAIQEAFKSIDAYLSENVQDRLLLNTHLLEYLLRKGLIKYCFCTSTLLEGVNVPADNLFVFDNKKGPALMSSIDAFMIARFSIRRSLIRVLMGNSGGNGRKSGLKQDTD